MRVVVCSRQTFDGSKLKSYANKINNNLSKLKHLYEWYPMILK